MKKLLAKIAIGAMVMFGFVAVAPVANADSAHAATASSCRIIDAGAGYTLGGTGYRYATYCYLDYDWFEEVFLGQHDGWYIVSYHYGRCDYSRNVC